MVAKLALGPASQSLGNSLSAKLHLERATVFWKEFSDGETYVRIEGTSPGDDLIIVQSLSPPQAKNMITLLQMASAAKGVGVGRILAAVPYLAYSRQDKRFLSGEALSAELVARALEASGIERVYVVEPHSEESLSFFSVPVVAVRPFEDIVRFLKERDDHLIVAPDEKRTSDAKQLASLLATEFGWMEKTRDRTTGAIASKIGNIPRGRRSALIFDDIIGTGGTIAEAAKLLRSIGFERIEAGCVHGLFVQGADQRMKAAGVNYVFSSDTVEGAFTEYSVADSLAKSIEKDI